MNLFDGKKKRMKELDKILKKCGYKKPPKDFSIIIRGTQKEINNETHTNIGAQMLGTTEQLLKGLAAVITDMAAKSGVPTGLVMATLKDEIENIAVHSHDLDTDKAALAEFKKIFK